MSFAVKFLGCKVSQADAMLARQRLIELGQEEVAEEQADTVVVNTCCITSEAESKSRQSVRRSLKSAKRVYVSGCASNLNSQQFADIGPEVVALTGTADEVAVRIAEHATGRSSAEVDGACIDLEADILARERIRTGEGLSAHRKRGFVKVQDGCDCHCAYCIIPTVRGPARSRPVEAILAEVQQRVAQGQPEMVMTGISVGDYFDQASGMELGDLMMAVAKVPGVERVRLSSVEVIHVKDSLIEALTTEPKVCPHLHIPMQSGDDQVLSAMGRHYSADEYLEHVQRVRSVVPNINITADVIVGFPTEDQAAFERTLQCVQRAGLTRVHTFSYSPRPGTVAAGLGDRVTPQEKKDRSRQLRGLSEVLSRQHRTNKLELEEQVLIDKSAESQVSGYTADYTRYYLPPDAGVRGELVNCVGRELYSDGIRTVVADA